MPVLAPTLLVAILAFGAYSIGATAPLDTSTQLGAAAAGVTGSGTSNSSSFDDQVANKQCPKPTVKNGAQEVYRSDKMLDSPFQEAGRNYYNLYGKACEGPMVRAFCSRENFCDAKTFGNSECQFDGKWQKCKTPDGVQVASNQTGTVCDACTTGGQTSQTSLDGATQKPPAPQQIESPTPGSNVTNQAYTPTKPTTPSASAPTNPTPTGGLDTYTGAQPGQTQPGTTLQTGQQRPALNQGITQNQGSTVINPTAPTGGNTSVPTNPTRPNFQTGQQNTFQNPQRGSFFQNRSNPFNRPTSPFTGGTNNTGAKPTGFSNLFANGFSANGLLSGFTNLIGNLIAPPKQQTVAQNTVVQIVQPTQQQNNNQNTQAYNPQAQQQTVIPVFERPTEVIAVSEVKLPQGAPAVIAIPHTIGGEVDIAKLQEIVDEYGTSSIPTILSDDVASAPPVTPIVVQSLPEPRVFAPASTSSSLTDMSQTFAETMAIARGNAEPAAEFREVPQDTRTVATNDFFHAISIPNLLDAISDGSAKFVRWVFGLESQDTGASTGAPTLEEFVGDVQPSFAGGGTVATQGTVTGSSSTGPTSAQERPAQRYEDRLRSDPTAAFRDVSPAHTGGPVALSLPRNIYPDMLPVPVRESSASSSPSFLQLVVENGAKEIKNLITTLWHFVLPQR